MRVLLDVPHFKYGVGILVCPCNGVSHFHKEWLYVSSSDKLKGPVPIHPMRYPSAGALTITEMAIHVRELGSGLRQFGILDFLEFHGVDHGCA